MVRRGKLISYFLFLLLSVGAALARADALPLESLSAETKLAYPPDPVHQPVVLKAKLDFYPREPVDLPREALTLTFWPPTPCHPPTPCDGSACDGSASYPPGPCEPSWSLRLGEGCFVPGPGEGDTFRVVEGCPVSLTRTYLDGRQEELGDYVVGVEGQAKGPSGRISNFQVKLKVGFMLDEHRHTWPPQPCAGFTQLSFTDSCDICNQMGEVQNRECGWGGQSFQQ